MSGKGKFCKISGAISSPVNTSLFPSLPSQAPPPCPSPLHLSDNSYPSPLPLSSPHLPDGSYPSSLSFTDERQKSAVQKLLEPDEALPENFEV